MRCPIQAAVGVWLPHQGSRFDGCAGARVHPRECFAYVELGLSRHIDVDTFAPQLSFFFDAHIDFFEEIAKFRRPADLGALDARRLRRKDRAGTVAALSHSNGGRLPDGAATRQQRRADGG